MCWIFPPGKSGPGGITVDNRDLVGLLREPAGQIESHAAPPPRDEYAHQAVITPRRLRVRVTM